MEDVVVVVIVSFVVKNEDEENDEDEDDDEDDYEDEELAVCLRPHLVHHRRLEVDEDGPWHVFSSSCFCLGSVRLSGVRVVTCLGEEGVEGVVAGADGLVGGHLAVGLDAMKMLKKNF